MMMKGKSTLLLLAAAGTLLLAGCQKTGLNGESGKAGDIRFSASASSAGTKTVYGAFDNTNPDAATWQSIDWVNGDAIRIYSDAAVRRVDYELGTAAANLYYWADYEVTGATAGTANTSAGWSKATLIHLSNDGQGEYYDSEQADYAVGNGLMWPAGAGNAKFYAVYPAPMDADGKLTVEGKGNELDGTKGILAGSIPATQGKVQDAAGAYVTDMSYAYMTAVGAASQPATDNATNISLEFYPAFTAFEFSLTSDVEDADAVTLTQFELLLADDAPAEAKALTGAFTVTYTGTTKDDKSIACTGTGNAITFTFPQNTTVSKNNGLNFTVFALPQTLQYLMIRFTVKEGNDTSTRTLRLAYGKDVTIDGTAHSKGEYISFAACKKHRINGLVMPGNIWNFKLITLDPVAGEWIDVPITSDTDNMAEATQFVVTGANNGRYTTSGDPEQAKMAGRDAKDFRQYWLFNDGATIYVTYKILAPEGGTWSVALTGDTDKFIVTTRDGQQGSATTPLTGNIAPKAAVGEAPQTTVVTLEITNASATGEQAELILKTYVTDKNGVTYSIDSETQLYDLRGHHHFVLNNSDIVN